MKNRRIQVVISLGIIILFSTYLANSVVQQESWRVDVVGGDPDSEWISFENDFLHSNNLLPEITWTSRDSPNSTVIESGDVLEGDHIIIKAELIPENSSIIKSKMQFLGKSQLNVTRPLMLITRNNAIFQIDLDWIVVENITKGLTVNIEVNFSNSNCDIYAWWNDELIDDELDFSSNLLDNQMATTSKPERGSFIPDRTGNLAIGCFNTSNSTGNWSLLLNQTCIEFESKESNIEFDTYGLWRNIECGLMVTWYDDKNEIALRSEFTMLSISNFFLPVVKNFTIDNPDSLNFTMSWDIYDRNADDNHFCSILFSRDSGAFWLLLTRDLVTTSYYWDTRPFLVGDEWMIQIRAYDNDFSVNPNATCIDDCWPGLMNYSTIWLGDLGGQYIGPPPLTTQTTTISSTSPSRSLTTNPDLIIQLPNLSEILYIILWWGVLPVSLLVIALFSYLIFNARRNQTGYSNKP